MKVRILSAIAIAAGLGLLLALAVVAQGPNGIDTERTAPRMAHGDTATDAVASQSSPSLNLGYTAPMTFTPEYTTFVPLVIKNYDPLRLYFDDFDDPNSGWFSVDNESGTIGYLNGEYQILLKTTWNGWVITPDLVLPSDYRIEADARQASGNPSSYGLMFGIQWGVGTYEGYQILLYPAEGYYLLEKRNMDGTWPLLINWTYSSAIHRGMAPNHLRVDRIGSAIYIYINETLVTTFTDGSFTGSGRDAGVRAYSADRVPVDVRFDNFGAYRMP